jgi:drug/metabolite transporter (DMT)-like permease
VNTGALITAVILSNAFGNFLLSHGLRDAADFSPAAAPAFLISVLTPTVFLGVIVLTIWLIAQLSLLSRVDLSFVLPVTAAAYVLAAVLGRVFLDERVTAARWSGILLICAGVMLVGRTRPRTTPRDGARR